MAKNGIPGSVVWGGLIRASHYVERHLQKSLMSMNLGLSEFAVMEVLHREGPLPITVVGEKILLRSSSMTPRVDQLEERRLIRRASEVSDRRVRLIELTSEGRTLILKAIVIYEIALESVFASLTEVARKEFSVSLEFIGESARTPDTSTVESNISLKASRRPQTSTYIK